MDAAKTVTATFNQQATTGSASGTLHEDLATGPALAVATVTCGGQTAYTLSDGSYSITAIPAGSQTLSFSKTGYVSFSKNITITAGQNFNAGDNYLTKTPIQQYTLTVTKSGTGSGTVSATGLSCSGSTCTGSYSQGTSVTLSASATSSSTFAGWSGGGCSGTGTCTVTMDAAKTVTATFTATPQALPLPVVTLSASPSSIANGATSTLSWSSTNSTSCTSSGGGGTGTAGSFTTPSLTTTTTYTVTCTGTGGTASQSATVTVAIPNTFSISGSAGLQGVTMTLSGANSGGTTTDANGNYTFGNLANGSYTIAPALSGYSFTPSSLVITVSGANITAANFTATSQSGNLYSLTGTVTASGYALSGVTMTLSGANSGAYTTNANGQYGFALLANGSYTVTPALSGYTFTPASSVITISGANIMGANFTGTTLADTTPPTINAFSASPSTNTQGQYFTINYTVSDSGGSGLKQIGLWRANINGASNDSSWTQIGSAVPLSGNGPYSSTFYDTPTTAGNYWYGIHVIDNANPTVVVHESVPLPVTVTSVPSTPIERITNGSFTSSTSGWTLSGDFWAGTNLTRYYTSPGYASGGVDSAGAVKNYASGYMYQTVTIPSNATSSTLSFWLNITSDETGSAYDYLFVEILNTSGALLTTPFTYSNVDKGPYCGATCTYNKKIYNLLSFKGQPIRIQFRATTDQYLSTVFRIDDVSLMADGN